MAVKIVEQWYKLMVWTIPKLGKFPRDQRFLLADKVQTLMSDVLDDLIYSSYAKPRDAIAKLKKSNLKLEKIRFYIRMCKDLKYISTKGTHYFIQTVNEIGRQIGGWINYKQKKLHNSGGKQ